MEVCNKGDGPEVGISGGGAKHPHSSTSVPKPRMDLQLLPLEVLRHVFTSGGVDNEWHSLWRDRGGSYPDDSFRHPVCQLRAVVIDSYDDTHEVEYINDYDRPDWKDEPFSVDILAGCNLEVEGSTSAYKVVMRREVFEY